MNETESPSWFKKLEGSPRLEPNHMKDRASALLRDSIIAGRIPSATKLVERDVARLLGISRAPARDALRELEKEGLIVSKSNGRYVIELTERDIKELYQIRSALERVAVEQAVQNTSPENRTSLETKLDQMAQAVKNENMQSYVESDLELHRLIWKQADNQHLMRALNSMVGPMFMFISSNARWYDWHETFELHRDLVARIKSGDTQAAVLSMDLHMDNALHRSLKALQRSQQVTENNDRQS